MKFQLTTDGSRNFVTNENSIGYGGYISNDSGKILFVFYDFKTPKKDKELQPKFFEHYGLLHGLQAALDMGITDLECFNDSTNLIKECNLFLQSDAYYAGYPSEFKTKFKGPLFDIISQFEQISFHHLPRERNQYADYLSHIWKHKKSSQRKSFFHNFKLLGGNLEYDFFEIAKQHAISSQMKKL